MNENGSTNPATPEAPAAIFARAAERARAMGLPYAGAVTPAEAHALALARAGTIVDVRTPPEYERVGHVAGTALIEWPRNADAPALAAFVENMREKHDDTQPLLLLCRSGARSHSAAHLLTRAGFERAYNILEGFEGPAPGQGWRAAGLPWTSA